MIKYEDYLNDHANQIICNETSINAQKKEKRRRRCFNRASSLQNHDLSQYKTKEEAEKALQIQGDIMILGCGGIIYVILSSIISWMIQRLLANHFDKDQTS